MKLQILIFFFSAVAMMTTTRSGMHAKIFILFPKNYCQSYQLTRSSN